MKKKDKKCVSWGGGTKPLSENKIKKKYLSLQALASSLPQILSNTTVSLSFVSLCRSVFVGDFFFFLVSQRLCRISWIQERTFSKRKKNNRKF